VLFNTNFITFGLRLVDTIFSLQLIQGAFMTTQPRLAQGMRIFTTIWFGQLISTLGSGLSGFALGVWLYEETGSTTLFALSMDDFLRPNRWGFSGSL